MKPKSKMSPLSRILLWPLVLSAGGLTLVAAHPSPSPSPQPPGHSSANPPPDKRPLLTTLPTLHAAVSPSSPTPLTDIIHALSTRPLALAEFETHFPHLLPALTAVAAGTLTPEAYVRALLRAISGQAEYAAGLGELDPETRGMVSRFVAGEEAREVVGVGREFWMPPSPGVKRHLRRMEEGAAGTVGGRRRLNALRGESVVVYEDRERRRVMKVYVNAPFDNWGLTVHNTPLYTFVPSTTHGLSNLLQLAKAQHKRVRASGYRHSWAPIFSATGEILVSMLNLAMVTTVPEPSTLLPSDTFPGNEFKVIELAGEDVPGSGEGEGGEGRKRLVRMGAAVTMEEFRRWAVGGGEWALPVNTLLIEVTQGGATIPICHGAGIKHAPLSDHIRKLEYIDAHGVPQSLSDPTLLRAAAGSFGLLGIVTHITFELTRMSYAVMAPVKPSVLLAIPPPAGFVVPGAFRGELERLQRLQPGVLEEARKSFVRRARGDYYSEWVWFAYQQEALVLTWNTTASPTLATAYPTPPDVFFQYLQGWLGGLLNDSPLSPFRALPPLWQATIMGSLAHLATPPYPGGIYAHIKAPLPDALHFRRGMHNMRLTDLELEIPIPADPADPTRGDFGVVQRAWWEAIAEVYGEHEGDGGKGAPLRAFLELRMVGESGTTMAPQRGNRFGTAAIQVCSTMAAVADGTWAGFAQRVVDRWMALEDARGGRLNVRPHWAKEWDAYTVQIGDGGGTRVPWRRYLKEVSYKDAIPLFRELLGRIGALQGWTLEEARSRFSNELWDEIIFS